jgi:hypothetical protein
MGDGDEGMGDRQLKMGDEGDEQLEMGDEGERNWEVR